MRLYSCRRVNIGAGEDAAKPEGSEDFNFLWIEEFGTTEIGPRASNL
jgi:hypothetical protein